MNYDSFYNQCILVKKSVLCRTDGRVLLGGFQALVTLTLDQVIRHTVVHHLSTSIYTSNFTEIGKTFCGRMYGRTYLPMDRHSSTNVIRSTRRSRPN